MRVVKCGNGMYQVTLKGISKPFFVESYDLALEIAFRLGGAK